MIKQKDIAGKDHPMRTHTVIDGNAFYEVDDECMERRLKPGREDKTGDADICTVRWDECRFCQEGGRKRYQESGRGSAREPLPGPKN